MIVGLAKLAHPSVRSIAATRLNGT